MSQKTKLIVLFWLALAAVLAPSGYLAMEFFDNLSMSFNGPSDSLPARTEMLLSVFPNLTPSPVLVLLSSADGTSSLREGSSFGAAAKQISEDIAFLAKSNPDFARNVRNIEGYYLFTDPTIASHFVSPNNQSMVITINYRPGFGGKFSTWLEQAIQSRGNMSSQGIDVSMTGLGLLDIDITSGTGEDFLHVDMIAMPVAIAVLAYCLSSVRLLAIPLVCLPVSLVVSFALMYPFTLFLNVSAFTPDMMGALASALNIDYALFLLMRFQEEVESHRLLDTTLLSVQYKIVKKTTLLSAHNILVSGGTIAVANAGIAVFPMDMLRTIGIGCAMGVICTVGVNLIVTPVMLYLFFDFFTVKTCKMGCCSEVTTPSTATHKSALEQQATSVWFRVASFTTRRPLLVLALVCAAGVPFFVYAPQLSVSFDLMVQVPRNAPHLQTYKDVMSQFGAGQTSPYYFPIVSANGVANNTFFSTLHHVIEALSNESGQPLEQFMSIAIIPDPANASRLKKITYDEAELYYAVNDAYRYLWDNSVSADRKSTLIQLSTTFPPLGVAAKPFLDKMIPFVTNMRSADEPFLFIGLAGGGADDWAVMQWVMQYFPYQILITFSVIFVFITVAFRSLTVPLRMLFTVSYTIAFTYGLSVLVFQYVWLDEVWYALRGVDGIFWLIPIQCFTLICGLALDYDVFLLTRVVEFRQKGFTESASLRKAVWKTGRIISFAGCIMAIAFCSLLFSQAMLMNQAGFMLAVAVLLDTFVIRTLFTPALMSIAPAVAFWPRQFPMATREVDDVEDDAPVTSENDGVNTDENSKLL